MQKKMTFFRFLFPFIMTVIVAFLLFAFLYTFDNKYSKKSIQPVNGFLALSSEGLTDHDIHYLIRDWRFYRDVLLSPDTIKDAGNIYSQYIHIGQYQGFELGDSSRSNHGCGSYSLTLQLPEQSNVYALELPEIFSAYQLYINDKLYLTMGAPEKESFKDQIQNRVISFEASGSTQILIAVADYAYYYSGIVYPPAFGTFYAINTARNIKFFLRTILLFLAFLGIVLGLYCVFSLHETDYAIFSILSLFLFGYTSYPLFHALFQTSLQPWYSLEILCNYGFYCLTTLLACKLCHVKQHIVFLCLIPSCIFLPISVYLCFHFATLPLKGLYYYSTLSFAYKCITALLLICITLPSTYNVKKNNKLFYATIFFSCSLLADRLLPAFEPVYSGWFMEFGGLALVVAFAHTLWQSLVEAYRFRLTFESEKAHMEQQLQLQHNYYNQLQSKIDEARILRHDMRQHFRILHTLSEQKDYEKITSYITEYEEASNINAPLTYCMHDTINALLFYYDSLAKEHHIDYQVAVNAPSTLNIANTDLSILLGNLLENAIEASLICEEKSKTFIHIKGSFQNNILIFSIANYHEGTLKKDGNVFLSTKHQGHGIGTHSANSIIEKYNGHITYQDTNHIFTVSFMVS